MWKIMVQPARTLVTTWRMRITCCISKATHTQEHARAHTHTHTLRICNNYCIATATMFVRTSLNVLFIRTGLVFDFTPYACLPLLTVPAPFILSFSLIYLLLLVSIALAVPYISWYWWISLQLWCLDCIEWWFDIRSPGSFCLVILVCKLTFIYVILTTRHAERCAC
jgi:hypothetical protein